MGGNNHFGGQMMINVHTLLIYAIICGVFGEEEDILKRLARSRGIPGIDYPTYSTIPRTSFQCWQQKYNPGMYADPETDCQVFHQCFGHRKESFLCPTGTTFNQPILTCDYWYSSNCSLAPLFYHVNVRTEEEKHVYFGTSDQIQFDSPSDDDYRVDGASANQEDTHESEFLFERMANLFDPLAEDERLEKSGINDAFLEDEFEKYLYVNEKENYGNLPENEIFTQNDNEFLEEQSGLTPEEFEVLDNHNEKVSEFNNRITHVDFGDGNEVLSIETEEEPKRINKNLQIQNRFTYLTTENPQILTSKDFEENQFHEYSDEEYSGDSEDDEISLLAEERFGTVIENIRVHSSHRNNLTDPDSNFLTDASDMKSFLFPERETDFSDVTRFEIKSSKLRAATSKTAIENKEESLENQLTNSETSNANTVETSDDGRTPSKMPDSELLKNTGTTGSIDHSRQNIKESTTMSNEELTNTKLHKIQNDNHLSDSQENYEAFLKRVSKQRIVYVDPMEDIRMPIVPVKRKRPKLYFVQEDASLQSITESGNFFTTSDLDSIPLATEENNKNINTDLISHTKEEPEHSFENILRLEYNLPDHHSGLRVSSTDEETYEPAEIKVYSHNQIHDSNQNGNDNQQKHLELFYDNRLQNRLPHEVPQDEQHSNEVNSELWNSIAEGKLTIEMENDNDYALADGEIGVSEQTGVLPNIEYTSDSLRSLYGIEQESKTSFDNHFQSDQIPFQEGKELTTLHNYISSEDGEYLFDNDIMHNDNLILGYKILQRDDESIVYEDKESLLSEEAEDLLSEEAEDLLSEDTSLLPEEDTSLLPEEDTSLLSAQDESLIPEEEESLLYDDESLLSEDESLITEDERTEDESLLSEEDGRLLSEDVGFVSEDDTLVYEDGSLVTEDYKAVTEDYKAVTEDDNQVVKEDNVVVEGHNIVSVDGNLVFVDGNRYPESEKSKVEEEMSTQLNHNVRLHENLAQTSKFKVTFDDAKEDEKYDGAQVSKNYFKINKSPVVAWLKKSFDMIPKNEKTQLISLKESGIPSETLNNAALNNDALKHIQNAALKASGITLKSEKARDGRKEEYSRLSRSFFPGNFVGLKKSKLMFLKNYYNMLHY